MKIVDIMWCQITISVSTHHPTTLKDFQVPKVGVEENSSNVKNPPNHQFNYGVQKNIRSYLVSKRQFSGCQPPRSKIGHWGL